MFVIKKRFGRLLGAATMVVLLAACGHEPLALTSPPPPVHTAAPQVFVGAGDIATCDHTIANPRDEVTASLIDSLLLVHSDASVFTAGDNVPLGGTAREYTDCYEPGWGRLKDRTWATLGNHEYDAGTADASFDYFGPAAGPRGMGYYSFDVGNWHIVALNSNTSFVPATLGSAQNDWLRADLAATTRSCVLAVFHHPRFYSCQDDNPNCDFNSNRVKPLWDALYDVGAELVITGHRHHYERFALQDPEGNADPNGIRQIIVGTGGTGVGIPDLYASNSEVVNTESVPGVIKLTLFDNSYNWEFIPIPGKSFRDAGSGTCSPLK